jgi:hypothetical protein
MRDMGNERLPQNRLVKELQAENAKLRTERERLARVAETAIEALMCEVEAARNAITHPNGKRAYSIDSADQVRVDALTEVLDAAAAVRDSLNQHHNPESL